MLGRCKDCRRGSKTDAKRSRKCAIDGQVRDSRATRDCWALLPKNGVPLIGVSAAVESIDLTRDAGQIRLFGGREHLARERSSQVALFSGDCDTESSDLSSTRDEGIRLFKD